MPKIHTVITGLDDKGVVLSEDRLVITALVQLPDAVRDYMKRNKGTVRVRVLLDYNVG